MKIYLDIGSTCIKVFIAEENCSYYVDRDYNIEPGYQVKSILENGFFVQGDNSDPLASEDSHNFGPIKESAIIAILKS